MNLRERTGAMLRGVRVRAGMSQAGVAERLGVSRPALASLEAGRQGCTIEQFFKICEICKTDPLEAFPKLVEKPFVAEKPSDMPQKHWDLIQRLRAGR